MSIEFILKFDAKEIPRLAEQFSYNKKEEERAILAIKPLIEERGHLTQEEFIAICEWKTSRSRNRVANNKPADVEECTRIAFNTNNERLRIGALCLLEGVEYPTASVMLHFLHSDPYPILDYRALEALGVKKPAIYTFDFWTRYVEATRNLANKHQVDMRTLDKALWQWSKGPRE